MVKGKKETGDGGSLSEDQASVIESKRLKELAVSRGLLSRSKANPMAPLLPTKNIHKCDGKDIVKRGNRKTKYLFAFPGLVAPIAGGKFGELTHLDSRNPTFYIEFPQGRLKLFGTIIYPKNKYLTMHFAPGRGDIVCEDCFDSVVVFPEAWWIGTKEENPEELKLPMPSNLQQEKHTEFDFTAGAGRPPRLNAAAEMNKVATRKNEPQSPEQQFLVDRLQESPSPMEMITVEEENLPLRRSSRKSSEKLSYAFTSSSDGNGSSDNDSEHSDFKRKGRRDRHTNKGTIESTSSLPRPSASIEDKVHETVTKSTAQNEVQTLCDSTPKEQSLSADPLKGSLRQATLTSFLTRKEKAQTPSVEVIEIEDSPLKVESGGNQGNSQRHPRRAARKSIIELESEDVESSEDGQSSSDSAPSKNVGTRQGRGRRRGRGGSNAAGRTSTPRKADAKRTHSITEVSSSDDGGG